ncbi:MAG: hypothetical protein P4L50_03155 [Anaerolineaceae bacterium]|nr:hypothetical protein [Anaerolineaceae bacterium]
MPNKMMVFASLPYFVNISSSNPITTCEIIKDGKLISWGLSYKRPSDIYDYKDGCRRALASAFRRSMVEIKKQERHDIWDAFLNEFPTTPKEQTKIVNFLDGLKKLANIVNEFLKQVGSE